MDSQATAPILTTRAGRVSAFGLVGAANTVLDFTIYNIAHLFIGLGLVPSNLISTSFAMAFSFAANKKFVFKNTSSALVKQMGTFLLISVIGLYVIQTGLIHLLTDVIPQPLNSLVALAHVLSLDAYFSDTFLRINGAKAMATLASLVWNYLLYKHVVFATRPDLR